MILSNIGNYMVRGQLSNFLLFAHAVHCTASCFRPSKLVAFLMYPPKLDYTVYITSPLGICALTFVVASDTAWRILLRKISMNSILGCGIVQMNNAIRLYDFFFLILFLAGVARKKAVAIEMRHRRIPLFVTGKSNFRLFSVPSYYFYDLVVR